MNPALFFDPDGYLLTGPKLMGRHSAGNGLLRAVVQAAGEAPVKAAVLTNEAAQAFRTFMAEAAPEVAYEVIAARRLELLAEAGLYFRPDVLLIPAARKRLRLGPAAYSLCGLTHTMSTERALDIFARIPSEPFMPWDAVICTSRAGLSVAERVIGEAEAQQRWRARGGPIAPRPMLPVIPLGVHSGDYAFDPGERAAARAELGLADGTVAALSAGRISINTKAHPFAMMAGLQGAAQRTGRRLALVLAGQAERPVMLELFQRAAAEICPDVQTVFVDGADAARFRRAWAAADVFVSLSDNIQETFGLTPIEAMAAGLPALVSDWDGYKDTVRDGIDGFRVPTWAPAPGGGERMARDLQTGQIEYPEYLSRASTAVAVDLGVLAARLDALVGDAELRRRMGAAGRARARETFDWTVVFRQYQALWAEQDAIRHRALADPAEAAWLAEAPRRSPDHLGPFDTFADFPTRHVDLTTRVRLGWTPTPEAYRVLTAQEILLNPRVTPELFDNFHRYLAEGPLSVGELAARSGIDPVLTIEAVARLAKVGAVALSPPD